MHLRGRAARSAWRVVVALDGFGIPREAPERAPRQDGASGSTRCKIRRRSRRTTTSAAVADAAAEEQSAPAARQGRVPRARTGRESLPDGRARAARRSAPQAAVSHRVPHGGALRACGARSRRRCCGSRPRDSRHSAAGSPATANAASDDSSRASTRLAHVPSGTLARSCRTPATCCITTSRARSRASSSRSCARNERRLRVAHRGAAPTLMLAGAHAAVGRNWIVMKLALAHADPVVFNARTHGAGDRCAVRLPRAARRVPAPAALARARRHRAVPDHAQLRRDDAWRWRVAVPGAPRCWCSPCRSGRCCSPGPFLHERVRGLQWLGDRAGALPGSRWSSSRGAGRAISRPRCGPCCRVSAGRRGTVAIKYFQRDRKLDMPTSSRGRCSWAPFRSW